jgi:hypothetical protein
MPGLRDFGLVMVTVLRRGNSHVILYFTMEYKSNGGKSNRQSVDKLREYIIFRRDCNNISWYSSEKLVVIYHTTVSHLSRQNLNNFSLIFVFKNIQMLWACALVEYTYFLTRSSQFCLLNWM